MGREVIMKGVPHIRYTPVPCHPVCHILLAPTPRTYRLLLRYPIIHIPVPLVDTSIHVQIPTRPSVGCSLSVPTPTIPTPAPLLLQYPPSIHISPSILTLTSTPTWTPTFTTHTPLARWPTLINVVSFEPVHNILYCRPALTSLTLVGLTATYEEALARGVSPWVSRYSLWCALIPAYAVCFPTSSRDTYGAAVTPLTPPQNCPRLPRVASNGATPGIVSN